MFISQNWRHFQMDSKVLKQLYLLNETLSVMQDISLREFAVRDMYAIDI